MSLKIIFTRGYSNNIGTIEYNLKNSNKSVTKGSNCPVCKPPEALPKERSRTMSKEYVVPVVQFYDGFTPTRDFLKQLLDESSHV